MQLVNFFCIFIRPFFCCNDALGGQIGAVRYSVIFGVVGTAVDYATMKLKPAITKFAEKDTWLKLPEWSPIQVLDEEAIVAKQAREEQVYRKIHNLNKEES